ncbi:MAG: hypothetical protein NZ874_05730 [Fimbriimonadales bacterium]|nr:hypothetical protein [Fimbriimonadales bacterium]
MGTQTGFRSVGVAPTPLRGTGFQLVQRGTDSLVRPQEICTQAYLS